MDKPTSFFVAGALIGVLLTSAAFSLLVRSQNQGGSSGGSEIVLKLGHSLDQEHPVHLAMEHMAERLREKSSGTVELQIFPNGQLGGETESIEQVQRGALDMTKCSTAPLEGFIPQLAIFGVPYLFRGDEHAWKVLDGPIGKELLQLGNQVGLHGLCYFDAGARSFYTISTPVMKPADLAGLKIRVQESQTAMEMVSTLGGSPTPMNFGELYTGLQQKMVDGAENNPPSFYSNRHFEVCKHFSLDQHARVPDVLLISQKTWDALPPNVQQWLQESADEASDFQRELWSKKTVEVLEIVQQEGVTVHYPDQKLFAAQVKPMYDQLKDTPIGELIQRIQEVE